MLIHWIWLAHRPGVSDRMKVRLLQHFRDPEDIYFADRERFAHLEEITAEHLEALQDKNLWEAQDILKICRKQSVRKSGY